MKGDRSLMNAVVTESAEGSGLGTDDSFCDAISLAVFHTYYLLCMIPGIPPSWSSHLEDCSMRTVSAAVPGRGSLRAVTAARTREELPLCEEDIN